MHGSEQRASPATKKALFHMAVEWGDAAQKRGRGGQKEDRGRVLPVSGICGQCKGRPLPCQWAAMLSSEMHPKAGGNDK